MIDTDYKGSCKSNYHSDTITTTTAPALVNAIDTKSEDIINEPI
jgi:hypothetical protein